MNSLTRSFLLCLAFVATGTQAAAPDQLLVGCWRAVKIVQRTQGSPKMEDTSGRCTLQFSDDQLTSTCGTASGKAVTSTYRYRIDRPGVYLATMAGSTYRTDLIGSARAYEYRVDGDRLTTATTLKPSGASPTVAIRVETEAARAACQ